MRRHRLGDGRRRSPRRCDPVMGGSDAHSREMATPPADTWLERLMPAYDAHEVHSIRIRAAPSDVHRALFEVTAGEVWLFRTLIALRGLRGRGARGDGPLIAGAQS